tara:strand:+ start:1359 stop:1991 length:633 start_codon:yes stop_codon:yes gene_type:complete
MATTKVDPVLFDTTGTASSSTFLRGDGAWTAIAGAGRTLISTQTVALGDTASSISVTSGIDSTYNVYEWVFTEIETSVNNVKCHIQCYTGSASLETGSIYTFHYNVASGDGSGYNGINANSGTGGIEVQRASGDQVGEVGALAFKLFNPAGTAHYKVVDYTGGHHNCNAFYQACQGGGVFELTTAVTGLKIFPDSGNIGATAALYGFAKS